jgi:hypothetical protein
MERVLTFAVYRTATVSLRSLEQCSQQHTKSTHMASPSVEPQAAIVAATLSSSTGVSTVAATSEPVGAQKIVGWQPLAGARWSPSTPEQRRATQVMHDAQLEQWRRHPNYRRANLEGHHTGEDKSWFPRIARRNPELKKAFDYLSKDHQHLHPLEVRVVQKKDEAALREFVSFLDDHLNREEMLIVPLALAGLA